MKSSSGLSFFAMALGIASLVACNGGQNGTDGGIVDAGQDADATTPSDGTVTDAPIGMFSAMTAVTTFAQNCAGTVANDPLGFTGMVSVSNTGTVPIGPISITRGEVTSLGATSVVTAFDLTPVTIPAIAPGATGTASVSKVAGTASPANACMTVTCGNPYRLVVLLTGPGLPAGSSAPSEPSVPTCSM